MIIKKDNIGQMQLRKAELVKIKQGFLFFSWMDFSGPSLYKRSLFKVCDYKCFPVTFDT